MSRSAEQGKARTFAGPCDPPQSSIMATGHGVRRRPHSSNRRLLGASIVLILGVLSATATARTLPPQPLANSGSATPPRSADKTALSLVMDMPDLPTTASTPPPALTVAVAAGPHLNVPVLVYHYIRVNPNARDVLGWNLSVTPANFDMQMALLRRQGVHTVTLGAVMAALSGGPPLPPHPVVLTFDDGYADFATAAAPVLAKYGLVGTSFVVSGFLGRSNYMTADQVRQVASMGMVIGAHTVHHVSLPHVSMAVAGNEIDSSKRTLEQLLGHPVADFAYPYGDYTLGDAELVAASGFRDAVTMAWGTTEATSSRFQLPRLRIGGSDDLTSFARKAGIPSPTAATVAAISQGTPRPTPTLTPQPTPRPTHQQPGATTWSSPRPRS